MFKRNTSRISISIILLLLLVLNTCNTMSFSVIKDFNETLEVKNGKIVNNIKIQKLIDDYFNFRAESFELASGAISIKSMDNSVKLKDKVKKNESERISKIEEKQEQANVFVVHAKSEPYIKSIIKIEGNDEYIIEVYEWIWLNYNKGNNNLATDEMGFSTEHVLKVVMVDSDFNIFEDIYDESDITGYSSSSNILGSISNELVSEELNYDLQNVIIEPSTSLVALNTIDVGKAVHYADTWVNKGYAINPLQDPAYYNTTQFGYYSQDCVNYVSQCLRAGGMAYDTDILKSNTSNAQWWFDEYPNPIYENYNVSPPPWRYVPAFIQYWKNEGVTEVNATSSTVFPGNPVYYSSHVTICVGYNSSGTPIINGHNRDVYHVPYTYAAPSGTTIKTLQISTSNLQLNTPVNAYNFGTVGTTLVKTSSNLSANESDYYKFSVTTSGQYVMYGSFYNGVNMDTYGYLFKESQTANGIVLYMYELARDDDSSPDGSHFSITQTLAPGTYYIKVRGFSKNVTGYYYMNIKRN